MVREYIFLASGCVSVGVVLTFVVLGVCQRFGISIDQNIWVVAIPAVFSLILKVKAPPGRSFYREEALDEAKSSLLS